MWTLVERREVWLSVVRCSVSLRPEHLFTKGMADCCGCVQGSFDATVRLWDCKSQSTKPIQVLEDSKDSVSSLHVLGHEIVTGSVDGKIRLYDLRTGMMYADTIGRTHKTHS